MKETFQKKYLRRVLLSLHSELNHYNKLSILSCTYRETWKRHNSLKKKKKKKKRKKKKKKKKKKKERTTSDVTSTLKSGSSKH